MTIDDDDDIGFLISKSLQCIRRRSVHEFLINLVSLDAGVTNCYLLHNIIILFFYNTC